MHGNISFVISNTMMRLENVKWIEFRAGLRKISPWFDSWLRQLCLSPSSVSNSNNDRRMISNLPPDISEEI